LSKYGGTLEDMSHLVLFRDGVYRREMVDLYENWVVDQYKKLPLTQGKFSVYEHKNCFVFEEEET